MKYGARFYHIFAAILFGWYLVLPHMTNGKADVSLALRNWYFYNERTGADPGSTKRSREYALVFDSAQGCRKKILEHIQFEKKFSRVLGRDVSAAMDVWQHAVCVPSDDPRLK